MLNFANGVLLLGWALIMLGVLATRYEWLPFPAGFLCIPLGALLGVISAGMFVFLVIFQKGSMLTVLPIMLGVLPIVIIGALVGKGFSVPSIHDIATSPGRLEYSVVPSLRKSTDNALIFNEAQRDKITSLQNQAYSDLTPFFPASVTSAHQVYEAAKKVAVDLGWRIVGEPSQTTYEAVAQTSLLRFKDDVIVSVSGDQGHVRVDVRSASRVGKSDLGANYARIKRFIMRLETELSSTKR